MAFPPRSHQGADQTVSPNAPPDWRDRAIESQRTELHQALIVAQVMPLVAAETDPVRRMRLLARAAAAVGNGTALILALDGAQLVPLAIIAPPGSPAEAFPGEASGITGAPTLAAIPVDGCLVGVAARQGEIVLVQDLAADSRFNLSLAQQDARLIGFEPHALVGLPVQDRTQTLGVLAVAQPAGGAGFDPRTVDLLRALAAQAALALRQAHTERAERGNHAQIVQIQEDERRRLARDLHDGPVQVVANAAMALEYIDALLNDKPTEARIELRRVYSSLTQAMRELRGVLFDLRPLALESAGLAAALRQLVAHFQANDGPAIHLKTDLPFRLPSVVESTVYLVVREALTNVVKHAAATTCTVDVRQLAQPPQIHLAVRDNGTGFDADQVLAHYPRGKSWGLLNMFERARGSGGQFAIHARPGQGTHVELVIPLGQIER